MSRWLINNTTGSVCIDNWQVNPEFWNKNFAHARNSV